jgi:hypothetical protein
MTKRASILKAPVNAAFGFSGFVIRHSWIVTIAAALAATVPSRAQAPAIPNHAAGPTPISADKAAKDGNVWGALVFASNSKPTEASAAEAKSEEAAANGKAAEVCPNLSKRLGKVFPYSHFQILGQHTQVVFREYESWVVPSKDVFLKLDSKGAAINGGLNLHVQFWQGQQVLVKTDTLLQPNSPLFIGGPKWRDGQLVFVLLLKKVEGAGKGS